MLCYCETPHMSGFGFPRGKVGALMFEPVEESNSLSLKHTFQHEKNFIGYKKISTKNNSKTIYICVGMNMFLSTPLCLAPLYCCLSCTTMPIHLTK